MVEYFNIFYVGILILFTFFIPSIIGINNEKLNKNINVQISRNILIFLNIFLILSFFKINFNYLLYFLIIFNLFQSIIFLKKIKNLKTLFYLYLFLFCLTIVLSVKIAVDLKLEWDASVNWIFKTQNFYEGYDFSNLKNVPGVSAYPHLGPYLWAFFWKNSLFNAEYTGRFFFLFLFSFAILINSYKTQDHFTKNILIGFFLLAIFYDQNSFSGYQEGFMFSIIAIIFFLIKNIKKKFSYFNLFFLLASLNIILWIKNEGLVWAIIILTFFFLEIKKNKNKKIILILGIFLFVFLKYQIFNYYFSENLAGWKGYKFIALDKNFIETILERIPFIIYSIIKVFFKYPFLLIATLILFYEFLIKKNNTNLIIFLILNVVLSSSIFLLTNDVNWKFHTNVGLDRMIYQTSGFYILTIANFFRNMFSSFFGGNGKN